MRPYIERALLGLGVLYIAATFAPASIWYKAGDLIVPPIKAGESWSFVYTGRTERKFIGRYGVAIRNVYNNSIVCDAPGGPFPYNPDATRPDPVPIEWWAPSDRRCHSLVPGSYVMDTCWDIDGIWFGLVPTKHVCVRSNVFEVLS